MALNPANVIVAGTGNAYTSTVGNTGPGATGGWGGWRDLGYLSDDGITEADDIDSDDIIAWQGSTLIRRVITGSSKSFEFTCIEHNTASLALRHPGSPNSGGTVTVKAPVSGLLFAFGFDIIDGANHLRVVAPRCEVTDMEDVEYTAGDAVGLGVTISAYPDAAGTIMFKYYRIGAVAA